MGWQMSVPLQGGGVAGLLPFLLVVMRSFASSVVRYLGDRPRWLRYRLRLADSVDVSYRGFPEITVLRFVRDVWTFSQR